MAAVWNRQLHVRSPAEPGGNGQQRGWRDSKFRQSAERQWTDYIPENGRGMVQPLRILGAIGSRQRYLRQSWVQRTAWSGAPELEPVAIQKLPDQRVSRKPVRAAC